MSRTSTLTRTAVAALIAAAFPLAAFAQPAGSSSSSSNSNNNNNMYDRNVYQQQRIEQGLKDGSLTVPEAANLERGQARISQLEARALADGRLTDAERARINEAQNRQSAAIDRERNDGQRGDPNSRSAQRMQEDLQRNITEQRRIAQGVQSGQITNREAARLERGEARIFSQEARAGADGRIDRNEQRQIQGAENRQSHAIHNERHDSQTPGSHHGDSHHRQWNQHGTHYSSGTQHTHGAHNPGAGQSGADGTAASPRDHRHSGTYGNTGHTGNNGNHYGQTGRSAAATNTASAQPGNRFGQSGRATTVAQNGNGRGNRR